MFNITTVVFDRPSPPFVCTLGAPKRQMLLPRMLIAREDPTAEQ